MGISDKSGIHPFDPQLNVAHEYVCRVPAVLYDLDLRSLLRSWTREDQLLKYLDCMCYATDFFKLHSHNIRHIYAGYFIFDTKWFDFYAQKCISDIITICRQEIIVL